MTPLSDHDRNTLASMLDELVPPSDDGRMPGAGALGLAGWVEEAARSRSELELFLVRTLAALGARHPRIALTVTAQIGNRMKRIESRVENLVFRNLRARIAHILLELGEDFGCDDDGVRFIDIPLSQQDLAALVGATRQSVNVCLGELRAEKLIDYRRRRLALLDAAGLRKAAEFSANASP